MSNVQTYTDKQILARLHVCDGWNGMPQGIFDVWVRSNEDEYNKFDDKVYTFDNTSGTPKFVSVNTGTSNAGSEGLKNFAKYNREGCAVLNGNQIVYGSHGYGLHRGKYPAYRQVKQFPYYRDNDRDNKAEEIGRLHFDIIGANCHKAGWYSTEIGGWSVACLVRNQQKQFDAWMKFMAKRPLTVAILDEWNPTAATPFANLAEDEIHLDIPDPDFKDSEAAVSPKAGGGSTVENVAPTADANSMPQAPPPPIEPDKVVVEKEAPPPGFFEGIKLQVAGWLASIGGTSQLRQFADDAQGIGLSGVLLKYTVFAVIAGFLLWLGYRTIKYVWSMVSKRWLTTALVKANSTPTNVVAVAEAGNLAQLEKEGWVVVRRI